MNPHDKAKREVAKATAAVTRAQFDMAHAIADLVIATKQVIFEGDKDPANAWTRVRSLIAIIAEEMGEPNVIAELASQESAIEADDVFREQIRAMLKQKKARH